MGLRVILYDLVEEDGVARHNSARLTNLVLEEFVRRQPGRRTD